MEKKLISIIVPIYNAEKYLSKCINSLISQTYKEIEILLINDGSKDKTEEICKQYSEIDDRIKYYKKENSGVSDTRNYGLERANGNYISFVDSDDWLETTAFEKCMNIIIDKNIEIFRFSYYKICGKMNKRAYRYHILANTKITNEQYNTLLYDYIFSTFDLSNVCGCIFKREVLNKVYFDKSIKYGEDFKFMIDTVLKANSIYFSNVPYYYYYNNVSSAINSIDTKKIENKAIDTIKVCKYILTKLPNSQKYSNQMEQRIINSFVSIQQQISVLPYNIYMDIIKKLQIYLQNEKIEYTINQSYSYYKHIKLKGKIREILKKVLK